MEVVNQAFSAYQSIVFCSRIRQEVGASFLNVYSFTARFVELRKTGRCAATCAVKRNGSGSPPFVLQKCRALVLVMCRAQSHGNELYMA